MQPSISHVRSGVPPQGEVVVEDADASDDLFEFPNTGDVIEQGVVV
jgi:hypothetical protein